jgi:hypothetical protein
MIDLIEFRKLLSPETQKLSDQEVEHIRDLERGFANAIFEMWLRDRYVHTLTEDSKN